MGVWMYPLHKLVFQCCSNHNYPKPSVDRFSFQPPPWWINRFIKSDGLFIQNWNCYIFALRLIICLTWTIQWIKPSQMDNLSLVWKRQLCDLRRRKVSGVCIKWVNFRENISPFLWEKRRVSVIYGCPY